MAEFPALPLWTDALLADTSHLTDAEFGLYLRILILIWKTPGCRIPADPEWAARKLQRPVETVAAIRLEFLQSDGNWLTQKRLTREFQFQQSVRKRQRARAKARWDKQKDTCHGNAPSPSPSPSPSLIDLDPKGSPSPIQNQEIEQAFRLWNEGANKHGFTPAKILSDPRRRGLRARIDDLGGILPWQQVIAKIAQTPFMCGNGERQWRVDLDWILKPQNLIKTMERINDQEKANPRRFDRNSGGHY